MELLVYRKNKGIPKRERLGKIIITSYSEFWADFIKKPLYIKTTLKTVANDNNLNW